jgi:deoxyribonuclease (pyrimidine dimer)
MTRINIVPVEELSRQHLIAEYREITRLPGNLSQSLNRKSKPFSMSEIPTEYVLGPGHVKYFFNKMKFLENRYESLVNEMIKRGYKPNFTDKTIFRNCDSIFYNDYVPSLEAIELNRKRIVERSVKKK